MKSKIISFFKHVIPNSIQNTKLFKTVANHKIVFTAIIAVILCCSIVFTAVAIIDGKEQDDEIISSEFDTTNNSLSSEISSNSVSEIISSEIVSSDSEASSSSKKPASSKKPSTSTSSKKTDSTVKNPVSTGGYQYNSNLNIEDNVFMDALIYTGYNMKKHRADGKMWEYVLAKYKKGYGWLSKITYAGGSTGYETNKNGKPDIKYFERNGFVCASFATYVYFNYLPNVAGIDTSSLPRPENPKLADSWYKAVQQWVKKGYSKSVGFTATVDPATRYINFKLKEDIPIGSIIIFQPYDTKAKVGSHVVVYAGKKKDKAGNTFHWVYHVGTKNGPEMCAVERMLYGPEAQWPMMVVTPPKNIRMSALIELELKDDEGNAISGVNFSVKNNKTGAVTKLGKTDKNGKVSKEGFNYGEYTLIQDSVPKGYTAINQTKINLTTKNNSKNSFNVVNIKPKSTVTSTPPATSTVIPSEPDSSSN